MKVYHRIFMRYMSELTSWFPLLYINLMRLRLKGKEPYRKIIHRESVLVIEGFPRCANSFAVKAFRMSNDPNRMLDVATHLHTPSHIMLGLRYNLPVLVLIRDPDQAVPSLLALASQLGKIQGHGLSQSSRIALVRYWTGYYARFYERLIPHRSRFVLGQFQLVTEDFNHCIKQLNGRFGTAFKPFAHTDEAVDKIFKSAKVHLSPSGQRDELKQVFRDIYNSDENRKIRERAQSVYQQMVVSTSNN